MIENDMIEQGIDIPTDERYFVQFANHDEPQSISDIADELELQMSHALEYAMNRVADKYSDNDYMNPSTLETIEDESRWQSAKQAFVHESGLPSASSITGMFLNFHGASVFAYAAYTTHPSTDGTLNNIYIHDIYHDMYESMRLTFAGQSGQIFPSPWNSDIPVEHMIGGQSAALEFRNALDDALEDDTNEDYKDFEYVGSALSDAYLYLSSIDIKNEFSYLGFMEVTFIDFENDNEIRSDLIDWVNGNGVPRTDWVFSCNQDIMGHSGKGLLGLRLDGVDTVEINDIKIENLYEKSAMGSYACGEYFGFSKETGGGHFKQRLPMQSGFSGNMLQGMSIVSSTNINFNGLIDISNLNNDYSSAYGISFWPSNDITIKQDCLIKVNQIKAGIEFDTSNDEFADITVDSYPNQSPEGCGIRSQYNSYVVDGEDLYKSVITFESQDSSQNAVVCNVEANEYCPSTALFGLADPNSDTDSDSDSNENAGTLINDIQGYTMYGAWYDDSGVCNDIDSTQSLIQANIKSIVKIDDDDLDNIRNGGDNKERIFVNGESQRKETKHANNNGSNANHLQSDLLGYGSIGVVSVLLISWGVVKYRSSRKNEDDMNHDGDYGLSTFNNQYGSLY